MFGLFTYRTLGKISMLTNIFQGRWKYKLGISMNERALLLGGGFNSHIFGMFTYRGEDLNPFWRLHIFQLGWFNHQLEVNALIVVQLEWELGAKIESWKSIVTVFWKDPRCFCLFKVIVYFLPWDSSPLNHYLGNSLFFSNHLKQIYTS